MITYIEVWCFVLLLCLLIHRYLTSTYTFWEERNIPGPKPTIFFGNLKDVSRGKIWIGHYLQNLYLKYKNERVVGIFSGRRPILVIRDPEIIKTVIVKDFAKFGDRGNAIDEKLDPLTANLFSLDYERWRPLRSKLTPLFTSGKLKDMFAMIVECSEQLEKYLETLVAKGEPIDVREVTARFNTDVIGTCAFGIDTKAFDEEKNEFRRIGRKIFDPSFKRRARTKIIQSSHFLARTIGYLFKDTTTLDFFTNLTRTTMEYRKKHNIVRNDFINILMELKDKPEIVGNIELTDHLLTAQAFVFFAAGFETSSTTISNALYELALNQSIQDKLRAEIKEADKRNNGDLHYDNIKELQYLNKVFRETLRMYPPASGLQRQCLTNYTFEDLNITVPPKVGILIPVHGIHHDPDIYPKPEVFDPERFNPDVVRTRNPMNYLPFGDGPRNCIGSRFAVYQSKIGLITFIKNYKVEPCEKTQIPYIFNPRTFILSPIAGIFLRFTKIE